MGSSSSLWCDLVFWFCWFSFTCSLLLAITFWNLGSKHRLLSWFAVSLALQHSKKLYLMTLRQYFTASHFQPNIFGSFVVLLNTFSVCNYELSTICVCLHVLFLLYFPSFQPDPNKMQLWFIWATVSISLFQLMLAVTQIPNILEISQMPFLWVQFVARIMVCLVTPTTVFFIIYRAFRTRKKSYEFLKKSSISKSLILRLILALITITPLTFWSLYLSTSTNPDIGSSMTRFDTALIYQTTMKNLANRYWVGNFTGPVALVLFATAEEPRLYLKSKFSHLFTSIRTWRAQSAL